MTFSEILDYYADRLIRQYRRKPKARDHMKALIRHVLMPQGGNYIYDLAGELVVDLDGNPVVVSDPDEFEILPLAVKKAFDIETAVGVQLVVLGKYAGVQKTGMTLAGLVVTMTDEDFRVFIKAVMERNQLKAGLGPALDFLNKHFPGVFQMFDHKGMRLSTFFMVAEGTNLSAEIFVKAGLLPRAIAVQGGPLVNAYPDPHFFALRSTVEEGDTFSTPLNTTLDYTQGVLLDTTYLIRT